MLTSFPWTFARRIGFSDSSESSELSVNSSSKLKKTGRYSRRSESKRSMDGTSISTHSSRDVHTARNGQISNKEDEVHKTTKRVKRRSLFGSLICCLGHPRSRSDLQKRRADILNHNDKRNHSSSSSTDGHAGETNGNVSANENRKCLLPRVTENCSNKKCAIIDLDETLVHSSFKPISNADFVVPVEIEGIVHQVYVLKRPHVDTFLQRMGEMYECVLFTASLSKYADPVADLLDKHQVFSSRLFRDSCVFHRGNFVKDLSILGRNLNKVIILDNSPASYIFHPDNAVPVVSWFDDASDEELVNLIPYLEKIAESDDVYTVLKQSGFTSHAAETTSAIQMQLDGHIRAPPAHQSVITQVSQTDSEDETEALNGAENDHEER